MSLIDDFPRNYILESPLDARVELLAGQEYDPAQIAIAALSSLVYLIRASKEAALRHAQSWRDFRVGAAAVGYSLDMRRPRMGLFVGANIKNAEFTDINLHAEQMAMAKARLAGLPWVPAIAIWGQPQADHQSGLVSRTLHPCGRCRSMLREEAPEINERTVMLSGNSDFSLCEIYTLPELIEHHRQDGATALTTIDMSDQAIDTGETDFQVIRYLIQSRNLAS